MSNEPSSSSSSPPLPSLSSIVLSTSVTPDLIPAVHALYVHEHEHGTFPTLKSLPSLHVLLSHSLLTLLALPPARSPPPSSTPPPPAPPAVLGFLVVTGDPLDPLLEDVIVHPSYRGQGLGRVLLERAVAWAWEQGASRVDLYCRWEVVPFYERCDFARLRGDPQQRCLMRRTHPP